MEPTGCESWCTANLAECVEFHEQYLARGCLASFCDNNDGEMSSFCGECTFCGDYTPPTDGSSSDSNNTATGGADYLVRVTPGQYPSEISWRIDDGTQYSYDRNPTPVSLGSGTHTVHMYDSYGDGWNGAKLTLETTWGGIVAGPFSMEGSYAPVVFVVTIYQVNAEMIVDETSAPTSELTAGLKNHIADEFQIVSSAVDVTVGDPHGYIMLTLGIRFTRFLDANAAVLFINKAAAYTAVQIGAIAVPYIYKRGSAEIARTTSIACVISDWSEWTRCVPVVTHYSAPAGCSNNGGQGQRKRTRNIEIDPGNCPTDDASYYEQEMCALPTCGITVYADAVTSEGGDQARINVTLNSAPTSPVFFSVSSSNGAEGIPDKDIVVLDSNNFASGTLITVTGQPDDLMDGDIAYYIVLRKMGMTADDSYSSVEINEVVDLVNRDNPGATIEPALYSF
jgi:hypothetical protein